MAKTKKRTLVLMKPNDPDDLTAGYGALGSPRTFYECCARFNTAPDGAPRQAVGTEVLYGPGMVVQIQAGADEVRQAMVSVNDQDSAWPVLQRMCKAYGWKMQDIESGQVFG